MGILEKLMYFGIKMPSRQEHRDVFNRYLLAYAVCQILSTGWRKSSKYTQLKLPILCLLGEISQFIFLILQSRKPDPEEENDMPKRPLYIGSARAFFFFFYSSSSLYDTCLALGLVSLRIVTNQRNEIF